MNLFVSLILFSFSAAASIPTQTLSVLESHTLPLAEISGLAWRTDPQSKKRQLLVVGDRSYKILIVDWEGRKKNMKYQEIDLQKFDKNIFGQQSEWESVFSDASGRIFIVKEHPSQILVVAADLQSIEAVVDLKSDPSSGLDWEADVNSKAEGLMPLKNGHILVMKEKAPLSIVEFTPEKSKAEGYNKSLSTEHTNTFPFEKLRGQTYSAAFHWKLTAEAELMLEDASGINVDKNGTLFILSDQKNLIARIGSELSIKKQTIGLQAIYNLPAELKQAEGMVIDEKGHAIIAIDRKNGKKPNLFLLSPLK